MHRVSLVVTFCALLAAASGAAAQALSAAVYTVEGWPRLGTRADGKLEMEGFRFDVPQTTAPGSTTRANAQRVSMWIPAGDAAVRFASAALHGEVLKSVLVEVFATQAKATPPAPFAVRLLEVRVTSVGFGAHRDGFAKAYADVTLQAGKLEIFSASQTPTGAMKAGPATGFDYKANAKLK